MIRRLTLRDLVAALGGDLHQGGCHANVPAPGHSVGDRSVSLLLDGDRLVIHSFGEADWRDVRSHLRDLGLIDSLGRLNGGTGLGEARPAPPRPTAHLRIAVAQAVWTGALPIADGDLCLRYLRRRSVCVQTMPEDLRRHPAAPVSVYRRGGPTCPALVAAVRTPDGAISAVEMTYLDRDGRPARRLRLPRKTVGAAPAGVAVRLSRPEAEMLVGEGVVTTLSAIARFDLPGWALLSAGNLSRWSPPAGVRRILIAGDRGRAGETAAERLRSRLRAMGTAVDVRTPPAPFGDWNEAAVAAKQEVESGEEGRGRAPRGRG